MPATDPEVAAVLGRVRARLRTLPAAAGRRVLVACSGGADSVALLGVLHRLVAGEGLSLRVAHVDHGLRPASAEEARRVVALAEDLGVPAVATRLELAPGAALPARARAARRRALIDAAVAMQTRVVALGHTATDRAETVLLHLTRGAGLPGLSALRERTPWTLDDHPDAATQAGVWWRPLLDVPRDATWRIADALGLPVLDDPTNLDPTHPRVRIRRHVLPQLRAIRPGVDEALSRAAEHAAEADEALARWADEELARRLEPPFGAPRWSTRGWEQLPTAVRTRMIRRIVERGGVAVDALPARVVRAVDLALTRGGGEDRAWDLHPGHRLVAAAARVWVEVPAPATIDPPEGEG